MVTFCRYCLTIVREAIVYVISNVLVVQIPNCIFDIIRNILPHLIVNEETIS